MEYMSPKRNPLLCVETVCVRMWFNNRNTEVASYIASRLLYGSGLQEEVRGKIWKCLILKWV